MSALKLSDQLRQNFNRVIKNRGEELCFGKFVAIVAGGDEFVEAEVADEDVEYRVELRRAELQVRAACDCAYFHSFGVCQHVWAAILASDKHGYLAVSEPLTLASHRSSEAMDPTQPGQRLEPSRGPHWSELLAEAQREAGGPISESEWPEGRGLVYVINLPESVTSKLLAIEILSRERKPNGEWSRARPVPIPRVAIASLRDPADREILTLLTGVETDTAKGEMPLYVRLSDALALILLPKMCATGRCMALVSMHPEKMYALSWNGEKPWKFHLRVERRDDTYAVSGELRNGEARMDLATPRLFLNSGLVFFDDCAAALDGPESLRWIGYFRKKGAIEVPAAEKEILLEQLASSALLPALQLPADLQFREIQGTPKPRLRVEPGRSPQAETAHLRCYLTFQYGDSFVTPEAPRRGVYQKDSRTLLLRDRAAEHQARLDLIGLGAKPVNADAPEQLAGWILRSRKLPELVQSLLPAGWDIEAEGKLIRHAGSFSVRVSTGIDWFELHAEADYGGARAKLPDLLRAVKRGESLVKLDDGSYGILPEEWLAQLGALPRLGEEHEGVIRYRRNQAGLLDALLAAQPEAEWDESFAAARDALRWFDGLEPATQPEGFEGQLRGYQLEGLSWMHFLRRFGFGGCLADDMGVGKTAQVLALLEERRAQGLGPSLVIVPRSLIFNWRQEAARFTPRLRVLDHTGIGRNVEALSEVDLVLTTYGTLRRDAAEFRNLTFDYVVLDESQAIKNSSSESAKAVRLLHGNHKLALSGTPVENHLGELWSLFEFLNPGMLGAASVFKISGGVARNPSEETRALLAKSLRPFILRRTKDQVAKELPEKTEQTLFCDLEPVERKLYDELRGHYRGSLLERIQSTGLAKSKMHILEALLRLRQAACHPGLIDPKRTHEQSAKLELLLMQLDDVMEGGHKALVFSQFTSMLAIVRQRLDKRKITYAYLDGQTVNRQKVVEQFQGDEKCKLFLISLKAGGLGLNLTAAEYVFLLDPWWNPAVEAQAIDRAHRIGQLHKVFAYRLIARDTVEEKVLALQRTKRALADAIINADNSLISGLGRDELELLLS
jgi:SNF2 family DNA or RNA helicase